MIPGDPEGAHFDLQYMVSQSFFFSFSLSHVSFVGKALLTKLKSAQTQWPHCAGREMRQGGREAGRQGGLFGCLVTLCSGGEGSL